MAADLRLPRWTLYCPVVWHHERLAYRPDSYFRSNAFSSSNNSTKKRDIERTKRERERLVGRNVGKIEGLFVGRMDRKARRILERIRGTYSFGRFRVSSGILKLVLVPARRGSRARGMSRGYDSSELPNVELLRFL